MKKLVAYICCALIVSVIGVIAEDHPGPDVFRGNVDFDSGCVWKIGGVKVTATAAQLNSGLSSATSSQVSNDVLKVYGSNLVIKAGGTVALPASTIDATMIGTANTLNLISNKFAKVALNGTNYYMLVYP